VAATMSRVELSERARSAIALAKVLRNYPGSTYVARRRSHAMKRLGRFTWNFCRGDLPNEDGFRFLGFMRDASFEWCRIVKGEDGCYTVENGRFVYLVAWRHSRIEYGEEISPDQIVNSWPDWDGRLPPAE